ncbi:MAG: M48 family metalloprotease [Pseudomonadota bacterium]
MYKVLVAPTSVLARILMLCVALASPMAAAKPKIPADRVIDSYSPDAVEQATGATISVGSNPGEAFDKSNLSSLDIVNSGYPRTLKKIRSVMGYIVERSPVPTLRPKVQIYNNPRPDAQAVHQGLIVVSTGYLDMVANEIEDQQLGADALAFVLAHEYAHLLYAHPSAYKKKLESTKIQDDVQRGFALVHEMHTLDAKITGKNREEFGKAKNVLMGAQIAAPWIELELYRASYAPYVREAEQQADYLATDLLFRDNKDGPKFNAAAGASVFRSIYKSYDDSIQARMRKLGTAMRNTALDASKLVAASAPSVLFDGANFRSTVRRSLLLSAAPRVLNGLKQRFNRNSVHLYYSAGQRVDAIDGYADKFYTTYEDSIDPSLALALGLTEAFQEEHTPGTVAEQAFTYLIEGNVEGARAALESYKGDASRHLQYVMASAAVSFAEGNMSRAIFWYRIAIRRPERDAPYNAYTGLSKSHYRNDSPSKALESLDIGMNRHGTEVFILDKLELLVAMRDIEKTEAALQTCADLKDQELYEQCFTITRPLLNPIDDSASEEKQGVGSRAVNVLRRFGGKKDAN